MASLFFRSSQFTLSEAADDIGEMYSAIADGLSNAGYTGVQHAEDVHGFKGNFIVAVVYLLIGNRNFWQVIACGGNGGSEAEAQADLDEVQNIINNVNFL